MDESCAHLETEVIRCDWIDAGATYVDILVRDHWPDGPADRHRFAARSRRSVRWDGHHDDALAGDASAPSTD